MLAPMLSAAKVGLPLFVLILLVADGFHPHASATSYCRRLAVRGSTVQPTRMGDYVLQPADHNGRPVYKHECQPLYLYFVVAVDHQFWLVGPKSGNGGGYVLSRDDSSLPYETTAEWRSWSTKNKVWVDDGGVTVRCAATCSKFVVSSGHQVPAAVVGNYTLQHQTLNGRPSYKHTDRDLFLFHHKTARLWMFGPSFGGSTAAMWIWGDIASPDASSAPWAIPKNETCGAETTQVDLKCQETIVTSKAEECGMPQVTGVAGPTILGGTESVRGKWPWMVSLKRPDGEHRCGGTLISNRFILTAAHCLKESTPLTDVVTVGVFDLNAQAQEKARDFRIRRIIQADNFLHIESPFRLINDIGLIELESDVPFDDFTQPACLPSSTNNSLPLADKTEPSEYTECTAVGWGMTTYTGNVGGVMHELPVTRMTSIEDCVRTHFDTFAGWAPITPSTCVFMKDHGKICKGDSGSPMICQKDGRWTVVGVTSWSLVACFGKHIPSVYTNVAEFLPWITSVT